MAFTRGDTTVKVLQLTSLLALTALSGCSLEPHYQVPATAPPPTTYREAGNWQPAQPRAGQPQGPWWTVFGDEGLDGLESQLSTSNQSLQGALARLDQARAQMREVRSGLFPTVGTSASASRERTSLNSPQYSASKPPTQTNLVLEGDVSYELDVFGRIRSSVDTARAGAEASAADLAALDLSLHAELATDYFTLRSLDAQQQLLDQTVIDYGRALQLTQNLYDGGAVPRADVAQAQAQLATVRTQTEDLRLRRAQTEHAIAVLVGQEASNFRIDPKPLSSQALPPAIDAGLPSTLLERRPDVAAAERRAAAANAGIGVTRAAYFPVFELSAALGLQSTSAASWITAPSRLWTLGPTALLTLFDGGRRHAANDAAWAAYNEQAANYRQTVIIAYQEVEDALAARRQLDLESQSEAAAVVATDVQLKQARYRYQAGAVTYLEVVVAENASLAAQLSAADIQMRRLNSSVLLVRALGGTW